MSLGKAKPPRQPHRGETVPISVSHKREQVFRVRHGFAIIVTLWTLLHFSGCTSARYTPPVIVEMAPSAISQIYDHPFDSTWSTVIQYIATSPFHIDHFEKASGLITLSYTSTNPSELISGGYLEAKEKKSFSGDYVDYLVRDAAGELQGNINIMVLQIEPDRSRVSVKASYNFSATVEDFGTYYWSFDTGTFDTRVVADGLMTARDTITLVPRYRIEKNILNAITKMQ